MNASVVLALVGPRALIVGFLLPVAIVGLVVYGVVELLRARTVEAAVATAGPTAVPAGPTSTALGILDERFARGEIDAEDYVQRRNLLWPAVATAAGPPDAPAPAPVDEPSTLDEAGQVDSATSEQPVAAAAPEDGESPEGARA